MKTKSLYSFKKKTGRGKKYTSPSEEDRINTRKLAQNLKYFDGKVTKTIEDILEKLDLEVYKIEEKEGCYAFVPKTYGQYCIFYNTSEILYTSDTSDTSDTSSKKVKLSNDKTCIPFIISCPHSGQDNVDKLGYHLFLNNEYKCLVINGIHPNMSKDPSPYQKGRRLSNADHSPDPSMNDFIDEFVNKVFPKLGIYVLHGMKSNKIKKVWFISSTGPNVNYNQKNINFFMVIAWALNRWSNRFFGYTNNILDDFYTENEKGEKKYLTSKMGVNTYFKTFGGPVSSVSSHIVNSEKITSKVGIDSGRVCHAEHAISTIGNRPKTLSKVHTKAMEWFLLWDENKHKIENVPRNLNLFDDWIRNPKQ